MVDVMTLEFTDWSAMDKTLAGYKDYKLRYIFQEFYGLEYTNPYRYIVILEKKEG